jgi:AAA15 family ATPase/GTPase
MLLRLIAENITSFKDAVEFNTFPASKTRSHSAHKVECGHVTCLRLSAIYGANGTGKSNLLKVLSLLSSLVLKESLNNVKILEGLAFKFNEATVNLPSAIAIEFYKDGNIYYYQIEFNKEKIFREELLLSKSKKDELIFKRENQIIQINEEYYLKGYNKQFAEAIQRLIREDMLAFPFLGKLYANEFPIIGNAYSWFASKLQIVTPESSTGTIPHFMDVDKEFETFVNSTIKEMNTGISELRVKTELLDEEKLSMSSLLNMVVSMAKQYPGVPQPFFDQYKGEAAVVIYEDGKLILKKLVALHVDVNNNVIEMPMAKESDGTRRIIEYMPLLYSIYRDDAVYVVDEMERSIHPILIKEIIRKLSQSEKLRGQLIFTTHESALLDQEVFRPDEIWFAQKDNEQATKLYPLSDFNIHNTANIENGYLNGRYGGVPFLSNLKDLNW